MSSFTVGILAMVALALVTGLALSKVGQPATARSAALHSVNLGQL